MVSLDEINDGERVEMEEEIHEREREEEKEEDEERTNRQADTCC